MKRRQVTWAVGRALLLVTVALLLVGCASHRLPRIDALRVRISSAGLVQVGDKVVGFPKLVDAIRSSGATPATRIELELPREAKAGLVFRATQMLREAGYGKTVFITARRAETSAEERGNSSRRKTVKRGYR